MFFIVNKIVAVVAKGYRNGLQRYGNSGKDEPGNSESLVEIIDELIEMEGANRLCIALKGRNTSAQGAALCKLMNAKQSPERVGYFSS